MPARKINFPVLLLCLLIVLTLGYGIFTTTLRHSPELRSSMASRVDFSPAYDVEEPPPPLAAPFAPEPRAASLTSLPRMDARAGPDVSPTASPSVAFNYRYAYRLPAERVSGVQEQHARACEQLGVTRCRITGMRYRVDENGAVEALLAVKLEPSLARRFGRSGTDAVVRAEGKLIEADITGTDADSAIRSASRGIAEMREDLQRLEQRLAGNLSAEQRSSIEYQVEQLRRSIRATRAGRDDQQESLASTPMVFQYASGEVLAAETRPEFGAAAQGALDNFVDGIAILFVILVTLLPWALLALLLWWIARLAGRRLRLPTSGAGQPLAPA